MSEPKKSKIQPTTISSSGKIRSPQAPSAKSKPTKKTVRPTAKPKVTKPKLAAMPGSPSFTIVSSDQNSGETIMVTKKPLPTSAKPKSITTPTSSQPKISSINSTSAKETIYIDVDDEITAIIEKLQRAKASIVALVLPKRSTVMQSVVNMRLLKRTAEQADKRLVLVTSETSLLPLAGLVGLYIAETPTSKPMVPPAPDSMNDEPESIDESLEIIDNSGEPKDFDAAAVAGVPVGELAGPTDVSEGPDEIILDDSIDEPPAEVVAPAHPPKKKNKKLAVPDFNKFRIYAVLGVLSMILIIAGLIVATKVMPRALVQIKTDSQVVSTSLNITLDTAAKTVDMENKIIPAVAQTNPKSASQQVAATGQQNNGQKAGGTVKFNVTMCAPNLDAPADIPTGSSVTSGGKTYITQENGEYSFNGVSGSCVKYATNTIDIAAFKAGSDHNMPSGTTFTGVGGAAGIGSTSGGTDEIVKVVAQADIDSAKAKLAAQDTASLKQDLINALQAKGLMAIPSTFIAGEQQITSSARAGDNADTVTVNSTTPYTMLGIQQADLRPLVVGEVNDQIDSDKQQILDDGIGTAEFTQQSPGNPASAVVNAKVKSIAGPELDKNEIKRQVAGKKAGDIKQELGSLPGVTDVQVKYGPFWVTVAPSDTKKITVDIAEPTLDSEE
ncbi:hypothetical protein KBD11_00500 [Candidatus Saccharibacteria bacterium]|nr:hypothetical protein [Candidatus Saccharibacteria bacterium]